MSVDMKVKAIYDSEISNRRKVPLWQIMTLGRKWEDM